MLLPDKAISVLRLTINLLSIVEEIGSLEVDYATLLKFLEMFRDFLKANQDVPNKT